MFAWFSCAMGAILAASPAPLDRISSAERCGRCHRDILRAWKTSVHATALEDPLFQDALDQAVEEFGTGARAGCLGCHAPTVRYSGDSALVRKVSWEGVTCDFCHSLKAVTLVPGTPRLLVEFDGVKTGPLRDAAPVAHGVAFSPVHTSSLVCAGCHEYRNALGLPVLTTYSEWQNSSYGQREAHCQGCHMGATAAQVVDPKLQRIKRTTVNLHQMPGSHSVEQLNKAIGARLTLARVNDALQVMVEVTNRGAGHMVPTGSPLRRLHLDVRVNAAGKSYQAERIYTRKVVDRQGRAVVDEHRVFLQAARVQEDTRLRPDERRVERFTFAVPRGIAANVRAQLWYYYSPLARTEQQKKVSFLNIAQFAPAQ